MTSEDTALTPSFFKRMRVRMQDAFNLAELRILCFDLDVNYDDFGGEGLNAKVREIISYFRSNDRLIDLVDYCHRNRPHVEWPKPPSASFFKEMRVRMQDAFNSAELQVLCLEFNFNYENLAGQNLSAMVRQLIDYFDQDGQLIDLVDYCRRNRPHVEWPEPPPADNVDPYALRVAMIEAFNLEELKLLCSDVEANLRHDGIAEVVDLEEIGGSGKSAIILNLIKHMERRKLLPYLVNSVRSVRPRLI